MIKDTDTLNVHSIESFGTHDGPGIRMVVFLQGCNLKCLYCHNPDTISRKIAEEQPVIQLVKRAVNMKSYFGKLGGVTVSGGEPLLQAKSLIPFFKALKAEGIHTNIDTNGSVLNSSAKELIDNYADLLMIDIKHTNEEGYRALTGAKQLDHVLKLTEHREKSKKPFWLRYVLIPGITDNPEELVKLGETFKDYQYLEKIEIQPYHHLGVHKWESLGEEYQLKDAKENTPEQIEKVKDLLTPYFKEIKIN
ncbi:pyruvate formate-lyase-activating protein [Saccharicrinis aurantiacus]|uniref:pyruvate formate-lyase-activating protein n=1 Tax=Saccharicrinis aurantiacus TaxID=1849719 RepID=UPI0024932FBF|nr:pyruvate formate-lyase-activating protein [Saccharicrinis aurantiacus]